MALTKEQLMAPRYKIIAGWPLMKELDLEVGKIYPADGITGPDEQFLLKYPHLFRNLEWWQERKAEEMPLYVRWNKRMVTHKSESPDEVMKVLSARECNPHGSMAGMIEMIVERVDPKMADDKYCYPELVVPATEAEFNSQKQTTNG